MSIAAIVKAKAELTHGRRPKAPVVLSTRIRLARNLEAYPFPGWAKESQRREILSTCMDALESVEPLQQGSVFQLEKLNKLEKQILTERHLISRELLDAKDGAGVVISGNQGCSVMINEEDHLRIQMMANGMKFRQLWKGIDAIDTTLEAHLDFSFSSEMGYLTACPTNVGTGLRASAMMHLPGLVLANQMEKVVRAVNQLGIAVRGLFGEGSDAGGSIFQISNQQTLGESEESIIGRLTNVLNSLIEQESNAREKMLESEPLKLCDKIGRAYGILKQSYMLTSSEAMNLLSLLRLAVDLKVSPGRWRSVIDRLFIESQPGHIQYAANEKIDAGQRDVLRARLLRKEFSSLPPLNFDKVDGSY